MELSASDHSIRYPNCILGPKDAPTNSDKNKWPWKKRTEKTKSYQGFDNNASGRQYHSHMIAYPKEMAIEWLVLQRHWGALWSREKAIITFSIKFYQDDSGAKKGDFRSTNHVKLEKERYISLLNGFAWTCQCHKTLILFSFMSWICICSVLQVNNIYIIAEPPIYMSKVDRWISGHI